MSYKVKTVIPEISSTKGTSSMEAMIQSAIDGVGDGWEVVTIESVDTTVNDAGCFGFGAKSSQRVILVIVFKSK